MDESKNTHTHHRRRSALTESVGQHQEKAPEQVFSISVPWTVSIGHLWN